MEANDIIMHMDLKDFFMTGSAEFLKHHSSLLVPSRLRTVLRNCVMLLMNNQLVTSSVFPHEFWKVVVASGMGLRCSSELADAAFRHACELCGVAILSNSAKKKYSIISYSRYRDNRLFVLRPGWGRVGALKQAVIHA